MRPYLKVTGIVKHGCKIEVRFQTDSDSHKFFNDKEYPFWVEYNTPVDNIPDSIAVIPFLVNVLPIIWVADMDLYVHDVDKDFLECIPVVKRGYEKMYPMLYFKGSIRAEKVTYNCVERGVYRCATFFSGGLDAFATLLAHINEKPDLITVRGADISVYDNDSWQTVICQNHRVTEEYDVSQLTISSNFAIFINKSRLETLIKGSGDNWWHGFQHGIGLLGIAAPLAYVLNLSRIYIASSYTAADHVTCASDPTIDNHVRFCGTEIIHDQYEYDRFEKTRHILEYARTYNKKPYLRVCYQPESNGQNCCKCEKCIRTAVAIHVLGGDIRDFGFDDTDMFRRSHLKVVTQISPLTTPMWHPMQETIALDVDNPRYRQLRWLAQTNLLKERLGLKIRGLNFICRKVKFCRKMLDNYLFGKK